MYGVFQADSNMKICYVLSEFSSAVVQCLYLLSGSDVLPQNIVKYLSHEIGRYNYRIALKCDRHLGNTTVDMPAKVQSHRKGLNPNLAALRLPRGLVVRHPSA